MPSDYQHQKLADKVSKLIEKYETVNPGHNPELQGVFEIPSLASKRVNEA